MKQLCVYHPRLQALKLSNKSKSHLEDITIPDNLLPHMIRQNAPQQQPDAVHQVPGLLPVSAHASLPSPVVLSEKPPLYRHDLHHQISNAESVKDYEDDSSQMEVNTFII